MAVRQWYVSEVLVSYQRLAELLPQLTEEEVLAALALEAGTRRRKSIVDRLIARAARLHEITYVNSLKEKFHGSTALQSPQRRGSESRESGAQDQDR